jgi:hypothetical protein
MKAQFRLTFEVETEYAQFRHGEKPYPVTLPVSAIKEAAESYLDAIEVEVRTAYGAVVVELSIV